MKVQGSCKYEYARFEDGDFKWSQTKKRGVTQQLYWVMDVTEDVQYVLEKDQKFVLAHVEDVDIESRAGICLDTGHQEWLTEFKKAIEQCADSRSRSELEGRAFSSTALGGQVTLRGSALANCEAANQRAEAVIEFLLGRPRERWACGSGWLPSYCGSVPGMLSLSIESGG